MKNGCWFVLGVLGLGCAVPAGSGEALGALSLALQQRAASGEVYRLANATLVIAGAANQTIAPSPDEASVQVELSPGDYTLSLEPGYALERQEGAEWVTVEAQLASENPQPFAIAAGEVTTVTLRFALDGRDEVALAPGTLEVALAVEQAAPAAPGCAPRLVIAEVDYDQEGTDTQDFVELYNAGDCAFATAGAALVLINGGVAGAPAYATVDLAQAGASLAAGARVVVGSPEVAPLLPAGATLIAVSGFSVQNGSPDGMRVEQGGSVLDALTYGGVIAGVTETASTPADQGAGSIGRCPDGADGGDGSVDFVRVATPTPGAPNACP